MRAVGSMKNAIHREFVTARQTLGAVEHVHNLIDRLFIIRHLSIICHLFSLCLPTLFDVLFIRHALFMASFKSFFWCGLLFVQSERKRLAVSVNARHHRRGRKHLTREPFAAPWNASSFVSCVKDAGQTVAASVNIASIYYCTGSSRVSLRVHLFCLNQGRKEDGSLSAIRGA